jgi:hypothetical protein
MHHPESMQLYQVGDRVYVSLSGITAGSGTVQDLWPRGLLLIKFDSDGVVAPYLPDDVRPLPTPKPT